MPACQFQEISHTGYVVGIEDRWEAPLSHTALVCQIAITKSEGETPGEGSPVGAILQQDSQHVCGR